MGKLKKQNAITLVALVITIVILLILAGISISALTNTGIFAKAKEAKKQSENAEKEQSQTLSEYEKELNKYTSVDLASNINNFFDVTTELHDENGNKIVVPAGYKIVVNDDTNNAMTVEKGIVIEDDRGNEYVWVPCTTEDSKTQLQYKRTEWDDKMYEGTRSIKDELTLIDAKCSDKDKANGLTDDKLAEIVEQIKFEKESVSKNGGYYIGRYEVGDENGKAVIKADKTPEAGEGINWSAVYEMARGIGGGTGATTYLCSSYAWDTAINFIQNNGFPNYAIAREDSYNENWSDKNVIYDGGTKPAGTMQRLSTGKTTPKCNIFDMGGNVAEFTTEVIPSYNLPVILRGGDFTNSHPSCPRYNVDTSYAYIGSGFRVTLFVK